MFREYILTPRAPGNADRAEEYPRAGSGIATCGDRRGRDGADPLDRFTCTRAAGHTGRHVAHGWPGYVVAEWDSLPAGWTAVDTSHD